ncbi:MAG: hypothetical protein HKN43_15535 [Rhodothermales bacterium]|nr:hypothetical protein [Rhodothermales bacterium]
MRNILWPLDQGLKDAGTWFADTFTPAPDVIEPTAHAIEHVSAAATKLKTTLKEAQEGLAFDEEAEEAADNLAEAIKKLDSRLQDNITMWGLSSDAIARSRLVQQGATDEDLKGIDAKLRRIDALKEQEQWEKELADSIIEAEKNIAREMKAEEDEVAKSIVEAKRKVDADLKADEDRRKSIEDVIKAMERQVAILGKTANEIQIYDLEQLKASGIQKKRVLELQEEIDAYNELKSAVNGAHGAILSGSREAEELLAQWRDRPPEPSPPEPPLDAEPPSSGLAKLLESWRDNPPGPEFFDDIEPPEIGFTEGLVDLTPPPEITIELPELAAPEPVEPMDLDSAQSFVDEMIQGLEALFDKPVGAVAPVPQPAEEMDLAPLEKPLKKIADNTKKPPVVIQEVHFA